MEEYKEHLRSLSKNDMLCEMFRAFSEVSIAYNSREPIYKIIYDLKDILDVLLERCK